MTLCAMALTACGATPRAEFIPPPLALQSCASDPSIPDVPAYEWAKIAFIAGQEPSPQAAADKFTELARLMTEDRGEIELQFILALRSAGGDCRAKVKGLKAWVEENQR